jgi:STE24 endopeptidase
MDLTLVPIPVNAPGVLEFNQQRDMIWLLEQAVILAVPLTLLFTGWGARLRTAVSTLTGGRGWLTLILFAAVYLAIAAIIVLPVAWWREIAHRTAWGRPVEALGDWLAGRGTGLLVQIIGAALILWIPFALISRMPRWWWLPTAAISFVSVCALLIVEPIWIRPLTTTMEPFPDGPARSQMDAISARCGVSDVPVFIGGVDGGATAVGLGPLARILIAPSYVEEAKANGGDPELVSAFAHELRHYMHDNWWPATIAVAVIVLAGAFLVHFLGGATIRLWKQRFGFDSLADPAALPLMIAILSFFWTFGGQPAFNAFQRGLEREADRFALEVTRDNRTRALVQARDASGFQVVDYYWFFETFRANHPSDAERVHLANTWRPWQTGQPGRYDTVCDPPAPAAQ